MPIRTRPTYSINAPIDTSKLTIGTLIRRMPVSSIVALFFAAPAIIGSVTAFAFYLGTLQKGIEHAEAGIITQTTAIQLTTENVESKVTIKRLEDENRKLREHTHTQPPPRPSEPRPPTISLIPPNNSQTNACSILTDGNLHYLNGRYESAIGAYRSVESTDRYGSSPCTAAIYASIASSYSILSDRALNAEETAPALTYMRFASYYNRAFAYATACARGDCQGSQAYWSGQPS